jgi:hypothetical protein
MIDASEPGVERTRAGPETLAVPRNPPVALPIDLPHTPDKTGSPQ